ncbi:MAG: D-alanyl-D-alanine carboxypeptidase family protein [Dorea sp.]
MIKIKKLAAAVLALTLTFSFCVGMTVSATEATDTNIENLTQEERDELYKKQLKEIYKKPVQSNEIKNWPKGPGTYGEAAIVMDAGTGAILYAKNIEDHHYPASITKVLTALVAFENGEMDDEVTVTADCVDFLQPGDSSIALKKGDKLSLEETLYATLLASANEAAYAVAENVGKNAGHDYNWFIEQMNAKCKELGGTNSNFVNPNGLHDDNHYTCAKDMALIGKELFKYPEFFKIVQTKQYIIKETDTVQEHVFQQKHKMLLEGYQAYYPYAIGGKTGYTSDALNTLITMADNGEQQLICVVLREQGRKSYPDTTALFEYVFKNFKRINVEGLEKSEDVGEILTDQDGGYVTLPKGIEFTDLQMELTPDAAPNGEATLTYTYEGNVVGTARAKLSDSYTDAHKLKVEAVEKKEEKNGSSTEDKILLGAVILLIVLIIAFIRVSIKRHRRRRRRHHSRR